MTCGTRAVVAARRNGRQQSVDTRKLQASFRGRAAVSAAVERETER